MTGQNRNGVIVALLAVLAAILMLLAWRPWQPRGGQENRLAAHADDANVADKPAPRPAPKAGLDPETVRQPEREPPGLVPEPGKDEHKDAPTPKTPVKPDQPKPPEDDTEFFRSVEHGRWGEVDSAGRLTGQCQPELDPQGEYTKLTMIVSGFTVDWRGDPVPGCDIVGTLYHKAPVGHKSSGPQLTSGLWGHSDKHGAFKIRIKFRLTVGYRSFVSLMGEHPRYAATPAVGVNVQNGEVSGIKLVMVLPSRVVGSVVDADGVGVAGATVLLHQDDRVREGWPEDIEDQPPVYGVETDGSGSFVFEGVVAGVYKLGVQKTGLRQAGPQPIIEIPEASTVSVTPSPVLAAAPKVRLQLVWKDGKPPQRVISGLWIYFQDVAEVPAGSEMLQPVDRQKHVYGGTMARIAAGVYRIEIRTLKNRVLFEQTNVKLEDGRETDLGEIILDAALVGN